MNIQEFESKNGYVESDRMAKTHGYSVVGHRRTSNGTYISVGRKLKSGLSPWTYNRTF